MKGVEQQQVAADEDGLRLDRWFRRHFPGLTHGRLEKLLRTGQIRVDGARARSNTRVSAGQTLRIPPLPQEGSVGAGPKAGLPARPPVAQADADALRSNVLYRDPQVIAINKPPGLATQGGSGQIRHLDAMLESLTFDAPERPRLVHRLDKDTSGILLLGRSAAAAARLAEAFRQRSARKIYWALTVGIPRPLRGQIDLPLAKVRLPGGERVVAEADEGKDAVTLYCVLESIDDEVAWVALMPLTGRTHQLRAHMAAIGTPIVGDGKYGGGKAFPGGKTQRKLHLHARSIVMPHPSGGRLLRITAPLPEHMLASWRHFGLDPEDDRDPFPDTV